MKKIPVAITLVIAVLSLGGWQACKKIVGPVVPKCGGPMQGNEPTSVMLVFSNANNAADADTAIWTNWTSRNTLAGIDNSKAHVTLSANSAYRVQAFFLNMNAAISSASYDMTPSIKKESNYYLVCFNDSLNILGNLGTNLNWVRQDLDINPVPLQLGLVDSFWTGADSTCGLLQVALHHQYKVKTGDCAPGYIDIQALDTVYISPGRRLL